MKMAVPNNWKIYLPGLVSQGKSTASAAESEAQEPDKFTEQTFHSSLVNFIVSDDQVCFPPSSCRRLKLSFCFKSINVIECPEFRVLLRLLRSDLKDTMIPHRTKIRELIVEAWRRYFQQLKQKLSVPLP
jgi:hypothetical protein